MDSQTALAVQSLLETQQPVAETTQDDDDMFQCGKCKKQFNSLSTFVNHKQSRCNSLNRNQTSTTDASPTNGFTSSVTQQIPTYTSVPSSPLTQIGQSMVLTDELMTFSIDQSALQSSNLQMATATQGNPFLSQIAPLTPRSTNCATNFSTISTQAFSTTPTVFPATISANQISLQQISPGQQISSSSIAETTATITISKPSPNKIGKKTFNSPNPLIAVVASDFPTDAIKKPGKNNGLGVGIQDTSAKKKLKCQYCDKLFSKNFDLQQHIRSHTGEKPFQCIVCGRAFAQKSNVKKHMQTHKVWPAGGKSTLPQQPEPQLICEDSTEIEAEEQQPVVEEVNDKVTEEDNPDSLDKRQKVNIIIDNSYVCQYCDMKFKSYFELKSHMTHHKNQQVYKCILKTCGESFVELDSFLEHTKTHEDKMSYRCHLCNKHFTSLYDLGVHQYSHSLYPNQGPKPGPRYFRCTKCMNKYATPEALEHHLQTTSHKYPCPHCPKTFACERYLRRHLPTHGTIGEHICEICHKRFKTEHYLKMHALIHSGEKPYRCEQCDAAFNRKDKLKRHMLIHEPVKKYKCPFKSHTGCSKEFNRPDKLKAHIISHSGIKPYKCKECGKAFSRRPHMIEHVQTHRNQYPFQCELCFKGFLKDKQLEDHKLLCAGVPDLKSDRANVYKARANKRKVGRPRKRIITVTEESLREKAEKKVPGRRGRPRKQPLLTEESEPHQIIDISKEQPSANILVTEEIVMIEGSNPVSNEGELKGTNHMVKFNLVSGQLQGAGDANMVVTSEHQDLIHSTVVPSQENHDIASTVQAVFTGPGTTCTVVDGGLISGHTTTCMVMTADSSGNLVATPQTAQLVTADGAAHLLTTAPDGNGQTYVTADHIHMGYSSGEPEAVLHGTEGLLATSEDMLQ